VTTTATDTQSSSSQQSHRADANLFVLGLAIVLAIGAVVLLTLVGSGKARGGPVNEAQITQMLRNDLDPEGIVYALTRIQERVRNHQAAAQWYPELVRLSNSREEQVGHTVADLMGQVPRPEFREALLSMLRSRSVLVKNSAALALAELGDGTGREQLLSIMQPVRLTSPRSGHVESTVSFGTQLKHGAVVARLKNGDATVDIYSPIDGQLRALAVQDGDVLSAGSHVATIEPDAEQLVSVLHALELVGHTEDLPAIKPYETANTPKLREQALAAAKAIGTRETMARK